MRAGAVRLFYATIYNLDMRRSIEPKLHSTLRLQSEN